MDGFAKNLLVIVRTQRSNWKTSCWRICIWNGCGLTRFYFLDSLWFHLLSTWLNEHLGKKFFLFGVTFKSVSWSALPPPFLPGRPQLRFGRGAVDLPALTSHFIRKDQQIFSSPFNLAQWAPGKEVCWGPPRDSFSLEWPSVSQPVSWDLVVVPLISQLSLCKDQQIFCLLCPRFKYLGTTSFFMSSLVDERSRKNAGFFKKHQYWFSLSPAFQKFNKAHLLQY